MTRAATPETVQGRADGQGEMRGTRVCLFPKSQDYSIAGTPGSGPSKMLVMRKLFSYKIFTKLKSHNISLVIFFAIIW